MPIIANGNVITYQDVVANYRDTDADGIMSAEGLLNNPALFAPAIGQPSDALDKLDLAMEYLDLAIQYPVPIKSVIFHTRRICADYLEKYQLMIELVECSSTEQVKVILQEAINIRDRCATTGKEFVKDSKKTARVAEAVARRKREEGKRKEFEKRMIRKAKREGKDLDFYLNIGSENPTAAEISELLKLPSEQAFELWKQRHSQHCFVFHMNSDKCPRERTCSFIHADALVGEAYG